MVLFLVQIKYDRNGFKNSFLKEGKKIVGGWFAIKFQQTG
jgi:hypothetical protein